jgi:hypothetical protein
MLGSHFENLEAVERPNNERWCVMDGPCGKHDEQWLAYSNPVDAHSEQFCLFCRIAALEEALRPFVIDVEVLDGLEDYWPVPMTYSAGVLRGAAEALA